MTITITKPWIEYTRSLKNGDKAAAAAEDAAGAILEIFKKWDIPAPEAERLASIELQIYQMNEPKQLANKVIGPSTIAARRAEYQKIWGRAWPTGEGYTDSDLAQLIVKAKEHVGVAPNSRAKRDEVREITLDLMRSDHEFTDEPAV